MSSVELPEKAKLARYQVILVHGTGSSPESNWFPWLQKRLASRGPKVLAPQFPTPQGQSLASWQAKFESSKRSIDENTILVGHSIGAVFILKLLERCEKSPHAVFLASAWEGMLQNPNFDPLIHSFFKQPLNYDAIKKHSTKFAIYHGDNDPYVPLTLAQKLSKNLDLPLEVLPGAGHLNSESGYLTFPKLLEDICTVL